ncbi:Pr6Pr family membrane protein [Virgibacillus sp. NKC19-3]|uniref:Pr6Pr family membrane protein n=1 Tax=Virgibacillus saliphilus TaxID=2831674 RepID=UPI001C9A80F2|nr:Pr6Pr family membrane protein [Virgibacillus sp. NKC19-3]MBY7142413.1 Pr6Pr family membrane protein [Virgibacillus sp. NKC19-3]
MTKILSKDRYLHTKVLFHVLIAATGLISVPLHIFFSPEPNVSITKFTIHSNIIVTIIFIVSTFFLLVKKKESSMLDLCKNAALIYMMVVLSTYHFVLAGGGEYSGTRIITNFTLHYLIPMFVLLNWLIFEKKKWYSYKSIVLWLAFPILYGALSLIRGMYDGFYPYFFLNPNGHIPNGVGSYTNVALVIVGLTFVYCILGFLLILTNRVILKFKNAKGAANTKKVM